MPPLPKRKYPKSRQGKRRSHLRAAMPHVIDCPNCKSPQLSHKACPICGMYRGRQVLTVPDPDLE